MNRRNDRRSVRRGSATLDYFLVLCVVLPLAAFLFWIGPQIMLSVYDLFTVVVTGPFAAVDVGIAHFWERRL